MTDRRTQRYARLHGQATRLPYRQAIDAVAVLLDGATEAADTEHGWGGVLLTATRHTSGRWLPTLLRGRADDITWLLGPTHTDAAPTIARTPLPGDDPAAVLEVLGLLCGAHVFPVNLPPVQHVLPVAFRMDLPPATLDGHLVRTTAGKVLAGPPADEEVRDALAALHDQHDGSWAALHDDDPALFATVVAYDWHTAGAGTAEAWESGTNGLPHRYGWSICDLLEADDEPLFLEPPSAATPVGA